MTVWQLKQMCLIMRKESQKNKGHISGNITATMEHFKD